MFPNEAPVRAQQAIADLGELAAAAGVAERRLDGLRYRLTEAATPAIAPPAAAPIGAAGVVLVAALLLLLV